MYAEILKHDFGNQEIDDQWIKNNEIQFKQYTNVIEAQSDIFAMTNFLGIWNLIRSECCL
ncbi:hypothetical protein PGLA_00950 [Paenibacillus glacialis]|uniref:Uncharacterized protein n=1 Tax=Paenibacillus glacialis TaxID=494026 RepID=A0A168NPE5_9BACL|nr:hypothetical protein PGLA_00950 [Paenibacillus glacialis]